MSGHSKWHRIKHKKAATDAKRGQQFTKLAQIIKAAARNGSDPAKNNALADAIERAKAANMPQANINRLLSTNANNLQSVTYECFGPNGTSLIVVANTDNTNRTVSELRQILNKYDGSLGQTGSVLWKFKLQSQISTKLPPSSEIETIELILIDAGAEDITTTDHELIILSPTQQHSTIVKILADLKIPIISSLTNYHINKPQQLTSQTTKQFNDLIDELTNHPDIEQIHTDVVD